MFAREDSGTPSRSAVPRLAFTMTPISRGFGGRRRDDVDPSRIPPGQYYERGFPVLSALVGM